MILIDANILLYAYDQSSPHHARSKAWLGAVLTDEPDVELGVATVLAFVRLATDPRVFETPLSVAEASQIVESWLARENVRLAMPAEGHWARLRDVATAAKARGPLVVDAHLATLAMERGASVASTDRDFSRFRGLKVIDPLAG